MVALPNVFDPSTVAPSTGEGGNLPISDPKGHLVVITDSDIKPVSNKNGCWLLALHLRITEGPNAGAEGIYRLNMGSDSADAVRIAMSQLSAICHCVNHLAPINDVAVLYNRPFRVVVGLQKDKESADKGYTEVKKILDAAGNKPGQNGNQPEPSASPAPGPAPAPAPAPAPVPSGFPAPQQPSGFPGPVQAPQPQQQQAVPQQYAPQPQQQYAPQPQQQFAPQPQQQYAPAPQQQYAPQPQQQAPNPSAAPWAQPR
jgi:hypothetical protein